MVCPNIMTVHTKERYHFVKEVERLKHQVRKALLHIKLPQETRSRVKCYNQSVKRKISDKLKMPSINYIKHFPIFLW